MTGILKTGGVLTATGNAVVDTYYVSPPQACASYFLSMIDNGYSEVLAGGLGITHLNAAALEPFAGYAAVNRLSINVDLSGNRLPGGDVDAILEWACRLPAPFVNLSGGSNGVPTAAAPRIPLVVELELMDLSEGYNCAAWFEHPSAGSVPLIYVDYEGDYTFLAYSPYDFPPQFVIGAGGGASAGVLAGRMIQAFNAAMPPESGGKAEAVPGAPNRMRITYPHAATDISQFMMEDPDANIACAIELHQNYQPFQANAAVTAITDGGGTVMVNEYKNRRDEADGITTTTYGGGA